MKAVVIFRDRVTYAQACCAALDAAGLDVHIVDHGSTWPAAVDWLATAPYAVHLRYDNHHPQSLWTWDRFRHIVGSHEPFVVTDCDVLPPTREESPSWVAHLRACLHDNPDRVKIGLGLRINDLPETPLAARVREWEAQHWQNAMSGRQLYGAAVDTTLAMYQPLIRFPHFALGPAARTAGPHLARHLPWYESGTPDPELAYYRDHMNVDYSHWVDPTRYGG